MFGWLYLWNDAEELIELEQSVQSIKVYGIAVQASVEAKGMLRLSKITMSTDRDEQHQACFREHANTLAQERSHLTQVEQNIIELTAHLGEGHTNNSMIEEWEKQLSEQRNLLHLHAERIRTLEAQACVSVQFQVRNGRDSVILPAGLNMRVPFLPKPVLWCPSDMPSVEHSEQVEDQCENMSLTLASADCTTATGAGLTRFRLNVEAKFVVTSRDSRGLSVHYGGDTITLETQDGELTYTVQDNKNGSYDISYVVSATKNQALSLSVRLWDRAISGSPFASSLCGFIPDGQVRSNGVRCWQCSSTASKCYRFRGAPRVDSKCIFNVVGLCEQHHTVEIVNSLQNAWGLQ